ncbi:hypothetical protein L798_12308 [Zootermopsis nevadensis]|uniref:Uncharacterized protein n=1 Tax=Zootermopsis nevadensis TaxID=136037 RepID=A0A067RVF9_ZOONE|nr:hypothetical protein L798_12308 [Zootermopsis nevadensis]
MCSVFAARTVGGVKPELSYKPDATEFTSCGKFHFKNIEPFIIRPVIFIAVGFTQHEQNAKRGQRCKESQSREMVISVYSFMKKEADSGNVINVNQIQNRVPEATGVSISTLKRILKE